MRAVLVSTYDLGRQPFGLASPAAWLRAAGVEVRPLDLSRTPLDEALIRSADIVAVHLPMHTATRLAVPVIRRIRALAPAATLVAYGLYAPVNDLLLRAAGVNVTLGPEAEADLVRLATEPGAVHGTGASGTGASAQNAPIGGQGRDQLPRLAFIRPDRADLPGLQRYAALRLPGGERRVAGYTEATRGCKHLCRHCPIVPVYNGRFRVVPVDVVIEDVRAQVAAGARHISFGDPDFLNGPTHALRIVERLARECAGVTYDVVIKVEHILQQPRAMERLRDTGCLFVTSAVESFDDDVLRKLDKGHTRGDVERAVRWMRDIGLPLVPTFVPFTPWTTRAGYLDMLDEIERLDLVDHVAPVQLGIRLLIPRGSRLLDLTDVRALVPGFDDEALAYPWTHPDAAMDALQQDVLALAGRAPGRARGEVFDQVYARACETLDDATAAMRSRPPRLARAAVPYLEEPWYC